MRNLTLVLSLFFCSFSAFSQKNYWVFFKNRNFEAKQVVSEKTLSYRTMLDLPRYQVTDFGPADSLIQIFKNHGIAIRKVSRWLNAVSVNIENSEQMYFLKNHKEVSGVQSFSGDFYIAANRYSATDFYISFALDQLNGGEFITENLNGSGVDIGVIDGGFLNAGSDITLSHIFKNQQIKSTRDFYFPDKKDFYGEKKSDQEFHGTMVLTHIGGFNPQKNLLLGLSPAANFFLARTESSTRESRVEEDNWLAAVEWLDSLGVRLVNSSLGYAQGFTDSKENYQPEEMDGQTSIIARAAKMAAEQKGMILVLSAGNEGENKTWQGYISTPGDVEQAISVGANDQNGLKMSYSSKGREVVKFVKPDVTAFSEYGTSFAAPLITGFVACMLQKNPVLKLSEIKAMLNASGDYAMVPNNFIGSGFPKAKLVLKQMKSELPEQNIEELNLKKTFELKAKKGDSLVIFHKKDKRNVLSQEFRLVKESKVKIKKPHEALYSTINHNGKIYEVKWKN